MSAREVFLEGPSPWGFRMNGGADVGHPLRISRVNPGSKAALKGVREGDLITSINGQSTKCLTNSESHALLRTVKENLRLGLNEDRNVSPKRRSREISKQSVSVVEKDSQTVSGNQSGKGKESGLNGRSPSKARRQRRAKLKYHLKKMFGFGKSEGQSEGEEVDSKDPQESQQESPHGSQEGHDSSLAIEITESIKEIERSASTTPVAEIGPQITVNKDSGYTEEFKTNVVETVTVKTNKGDIISETIYDNLRFPNTGIRTCLKKGDETPPVLKRVNFDSNGRTGIKSEVIEVIETITIEEEKPPDLPERVLIKSFETVPDVLPEVERRPFDLAKAVNDCLDFIREERKHSSWNLPPKSDDFVIYANINPPAEFKARKASQEREQVEIVIHEPEESTVDKVAKEDFVVCIKENVEFGGAEERNRHGKAPLYKDDEDDYELCAVEVVTHPPVEEDKLRGFLEHLDNGKQQTCTCHTNPYIYYYPGRRYLEAISEENSDLSDPDRPWENSELIRKNNDIEGIPEDWFGSQDGIDTSWQDGKSLEEASDVPIVSDSHSDTDFTTSAEDTKDRVETKISSVKTSIINRTDVKIKEVSKTVSFSKEPIIREVVTDKPVPPKEPITTKSIPSKEVVKNVVSSYYNKQFSIADVSSKPPKHPPSVAQKEIKVETEPSAINDVELVYIDSSDSDVTSVKSEILVLHPKKEDPDKIEVNKKSCEENLTQEKVEEEISATSFADIAISNNQKLINELAESLQKISVVPDAIPHSIKARATPPIPPEKCNISLITNDELMGIEYADKSTMVEMDGEREVASLKELSKNVVKALPCGQRILIELGIENQRERYDSCSDYFPETSEYSYSSGTNLVSLGSELTKSFGDINEDKDDDAHSSGSSGLIFISDPSLFKQNPNADVDKKWIDTPVADDPRLFLCVSPTQSKNLEQNPKLASDLYDLHTKFVNRRGYHEKPASPSHSNDPDLISIDSKSTKHDLSDYTPEILFETENKSSNPNKSEENLNLINDLKSLDVYSEHPTSYDVVIVSITDKTTKEQTPERDTSNEKHEFEESEIDQSRLLKLIQSESSQVRSVEEEDKTGNTNDSDPGIERQEGAHKVEADEDVPEEHEDMNQNSDERVFDAIKYKISKQGDIAIYEGLTSRSEEFKQQAQARPKSLPPSGEIFRKKMYEEYMDKVAERIERRQQKVIKISGVVHTGSQSYGGSQPKMENEFMEKVRERMQKLGIPMDGEDGQEVDKKEDDNEESSQIPKHVKELMELMDESGVWSPTHTPEVERKKYSFTESPDRKAESKTDEKSEDQPVVWTPPSAGNSPTLERKFRTINFQSPTQKRKEYRPTEDLQQLAKEIKSEQTFETKTRLVTSTSENSTLSTQLRLPTAQNPTITLLQKAREGQIPKGAQYLEETKSEQNLQSTSSVIPDEILYKVKQEHRSKSVESPKTIIELTPRKFEGIGPVTREGTPLALRSEIKDDNQQRWYKRMYDSLHKAEQNKDYVTVRYKTKRKGLYPYSISAGGYLSEPERVYDSDASISKYATLDRRRIRNKDSDFTTSTMPRNKYTPAVKHAVNLYKNQPGKIEDYEPGHSSIAEKETKQWWDEVMDIFDEELNKESRPIKPPTTITVGKPFTSVLKDTGGYESDSTLIFRRREDTMEGQLMSPAEQKMAYKVIQKGGEVPLHGLRKPAPERPKEPLGNPIPTPPRDHYSRQGLRGRQESPHRYLESEVNIHYRSPIRTEAKMAWPEEELAQKQAEVMRRIYQEQRRTKYLSELQDMYSRRHTDNFIPSQKSPIPLNRYDDFPVEAQPPRPRDRTPEPKLVARALYNFIGQSSRELSFRRGDIIFVRRQIDKNWYEGEHNAMIGLFPFNYVEIIPYDGIRTLPKKATEGQARAKFNFQAQTHLELSLVRGELVLLTRRVDENWFEGRIGNRKGIFPVSYVEVLVEPGEKNVSTAGPVTNKPVVAPASHSVMLNGAKDLGQQHYQPPRPASSYTTASLSSKHNLDEIPLMRHSLHIETQSDPVPYRVLYNYKPQNDDELELNEGDIVYVMEKCDDGWYVGSMHNSGQFGTFPGNYVQRIQ